MSLTNYLSGYTYTPEQERECSTLPTPEWEAFLCGFIDSNGTFPISQSEPYLLVQSSSTDLLSRIHTEYPSTVLDTKKGRLECEGVNVLDFLGSVYRVYTPPHPYTDRGLYAVFQSYVYPAPVCHVVRHCPDAVIPFKHRFSDAGLDLTLIAETKRYHSHTILYDTGISLVIPHGYYAEIVPRSSLSKTGYMLANNVGIIDNGYRGRLYVPLIKIHQDMPDLTLPIACCQLLFRRQIYTTVKEILPEESSTTGRGAGGFGSTG